jgi:hypothetical protein
MHQNQSKRAQKAAKRTWHTTLQPKLLKAAESSSIKPFAQELPTLTGDKLLGPILIKHDSECTVCWIMCAGTQKAQNS